MNKAVELRTYGELVLKDQQRITLKDLEDFCQEARRLGLEGNAPLHLSRQGILGPISCIRFTVPIQQPR